MSIEAVREHLRKFGLEDRIREFEVSSATVELAANALGCEPCRIAKSLAFVREDGAILVVAAGDARIDGPKFKAAFGMKPKMLKPDETAARVGHAVGGVCPFAVNDGVRVCLDVSLKRFDIVYPACGSSNSGVGLTIDELEAASGSRDWVDVCKVP